MTLNSIQARGPVMNLKQSSSNKAMPPNSNLSKDDKSIRDASKKVLLKDLDCPQDSIDVSAIVCNSEQLAGLIEEEIFEITGKNCKNNKTYREKIQKFIHNRISGNRNAFIRNALKTGKMPYKDFCRLNDKQYEDDSYFNNLLGVSNQSNTNKTSTTSKPPKIKVAQINLMNKSIEFGNIVKEESINFDYVGENPIPDLNTNNTTSNIQNTTNIKEGQNNNLQDNEMVESKNPFISNSENATESPFKSSSQNIIKEIVKTDEYLNSVKIDSQFQSLQFSNLNTNHISNINSSTNVNTNQNSLKNLNAPFSSAVNSGNNTANQQQQTLQQPSERAASALNNPFSSEVSSSKNLNINESLDNSIVSEKAGNKLSKLKDFLNSSLNKVPDSRNGKNLKNERSKMNQTYNISLNKQNIMIENRSEKERDIANDNVSEIDTKSVKEKITEPKFNINCIDNNQNKPNALKTPSNIQLNNQVEYNLSTEREQELYSLREKNAILEKDNIELKMAKNQQERDLDLEKNKVELYEIELKNLRDINTDLKIKYSNINEEIIKLEISKLNLSLSNKDKENFLLIKENKSLKEKIISFELHLKNILEENNRYREDVENRFKNYKYELEKLNTAIPEELQLSNYDKREKNDNIITPPIENNQKKEQKLENSNQRNNNINEMNQNNLQKNENSQNLFDNDNEFSSNHYNKVSSLPTQIEEISKTVGNNYCNTSKGNTLIHSNVANESIEKLNTNSNVEQITTSKKLIILPPPKKSDFINNNQSVNKINKIPIHNRFTPTNFTVNENSNNAYQPNTNSNLFFDDVNKEDDMIFGQKKTKEEPKKDSEQSKALDKIETDTYNINTENNQNENFLDYDVISNSQANKKNNFFYECDMENEMLNKSQNFSNQPVTGENARGKSPINEQTHQFLNPESGATQNIEKNNKNNFFDDNDEDSMKNTYNLFNDNKSQNTQKGNQLPSKNIFSNVSNQSKLVIEKKNDKQMAIPLKNNKTNVNPAQKIDNLNSDPFNFSQTRDDNFENIFDSLASAPKTRNEDKSTNYFDD